MLVSLFCRITGVGAVLQRIPKSIHFVPVVLVVLVSALLVVYLPWLTVPLTSVVGGRTACRLRVSTSKTGLQRRCESSVGGALGGLLGSNLCVLIAICRSDGDQVISHGVLFAAATVCGMMVGAVIGAFCGWGCAQDRRVKRP